MHSSIAPEDLGRRLGEAYGIRGLHLEKLLPVTGRNLNAILTDGATRYVARCYLRNRNRARITFQLDFQAHLRGKGLPLPEVLHTADDQQVVMLDGAGWVLFEHIDGSGFDPKSAEERRSSAQALVTFHEGGRDFAGATVADDTIPDLRRWWTHGREDIEDLRAMFAGREVDEELGYIAAWQDRLIRDYPLDVVDQLPTAWVHGDYHGDNLAFRDSKVVGIFDLDVVHHSWRLDDIARAVFYFARADSADEFVSTFELTDLERSALPAYAVAVHARTAPRYRVREREGSDPAAVLRRHVARMRSIAASIPH